jgi:protein-disulfide isomerase
MKEMRVLLFSLFFISSAVLSPISRAAEFSPNQKQAIEQIVHDYLLENPEVLVEVSRALQQKEQQEAERRALGVIPEFAQQLFFAEQTPVVGNPMGKVTLVEFFDYRCGVCKNMSSIVKNLQQAYPELRIVYKELPIFGGSSNFAASAALAAQQQGKYAEFHNALMSADKVDSNDDVLAIAQSVGLDVAKLQQDMQDSRIEEELKANFQLARDLRLGGTPAFILVKTPKPAAKVSRESLAPIFIPGSTSEENLRKHIEKLSK